MSEEIVLHRTIPAAPARVFQAWIDPDLLARWMSPVGHASADVDARVGGQLRVTMIGEGRRIEHTGEYLEMQAPHRLVFTWRSPYTGDAASRVTIELVAVPGGTDLTLRHELLPRGTAESHAGGWGSMLDRLATALAAREKVRRGA